MCLILNCSNNYSSNYQNNSETMEVLSQLQDFSSSYAGYHGYVSVIVCIIGVICNSINVIVLTRPKMRNKTNLLLTALAVMDLCTMTSYIPFALQFYILHGLKPNPLRNTYSWVNFFLFHVNFTVTTHTCAIWLGVLLSIFRYAYIKVPREKNIIYSTQRVKLAICAVVGMSVMILIPNYMSITTKAVTQDNVTSHYELTSLEFNTTFGFVITLINFWIHALLIKLLPCILLSIFGVLLICTLRSSNQKRMELRRRSTISLTTSRRRSVRTREHSRTTFMLVVVIILFLITELPQGILALCSGLKTGFFEAYYIPLGDIMDIMALLNNGINFMLYCSMSKQFRKTFLHLFMPTINNMQHRKYKASVSAVSQGQMSGVRAVELAHCCGDHEANVPLTTANIDQ